MAITYDPSSNTITVTGYTSDTPCTFTDIYNADKAGTLSLVDRDGITAVDTDPVDNTYNLRPADEKLMGGAKNDLWIVIENWSGFTDATIRLIGTDEAGNALQEDIAVTGNGTYYASELFKTLTQTQVVAVNGTGSFDYSLVQGQWGVVWKQGDNQFRFDSKLQIGDGSTATYFADTGKQILNPLNDDFIFVENNANLRFGEVVDEAKRETKNGIQLIHLGSYKDTIKYSGKMELYSTTIFAPSHSALECYNSSANHRLWNCTLIGMQGYQTGVPPNGDIYRLTLQSGIAIPPFIFSYANDFLGTNLTYGFRLYSMSGYTFTVRNVILKNIAQQSFYFSSVSYSTINCIDFDLEAWTFSWSSSDGTKVNRQYEFDLKVIDKDENPISDATVKIWDKGGNLVTNETTDADGKIPTQTLNYGYYTQANGNTPTMQTPHTIEISKVGYKTYEEKFTLDKKIDWTIALSQIKELNFSKLARIFVD